MACCATATAAAPSGMSPTASCASAMRTTRREAASGYLMLTNMPQAAASAAPVKTTTGLSQNAPP